MLRTKELVGHLGASLDRAALAAGRALALGPRPPGAPGHPLAVVRRAGDVFIVSHTTRLPRGAWAARIGSRTPHLRDYIDEHAG